MAALCYVAALCYNASMAILKKIGLTALALTGALLGPVRAQTPAASPPATFPFVLPWDDATPGAATDVSFLNTKPAGANGRIVPKEGHFVEARTGTRVRFLGVNLAARAAFPSHADAEAVAARLAKYGVNIVRLHHMDNDNWGPDAHIWDDSAKDRRHINPAQLDKLDYLIAQLKKNGIYADINLHVSRQFTEADGFPPSVAQIPFDFDKRVDNYDRRMIALQKEYARQLLTHVNPYTGLAYTDDPCVAVVEINNENSLMGSPWGAGLGSGLDTLPEPFRGELVGFWNDWLLKKYGTDAKVQAAWMQGVTPPGASLTSDAAAWSLEAQGNSAAASNTVPRADAPLGLPLRAAPDVQVNVTRVDDTDWHVQAHVTGLDFKDGHTYTISFRAKADAPRPMPVAAGLDEADWHQIGLATSADLTTDWKTFHFTFEAQGVVPDHGRVAFTLGGRTGTVWISDLQVKPGAEGGGLLPGQSLATKTVPMPLTATRPQGADWALFLADTERDYANEMRVYLKNDLHVHANLICSQLGYGGLFSVYREANMDFADSHAYWQHPSFPHKPWDSLDWNIPNTPMVADLAAGGGTLRTLAQYRVAGKPYSVSEYNEPAPNDFQAETVPVLASFAAFQDWDMLYLFDYGDYGAGVDTEKIAGYFAVGSNPAKWAFLPAAALIFRAGEQFPAARTSEAMLPRQYSPGLLSPASVWPSSTDGSGSAFLSQRLALNPGRASRQPALLTVKPETSRAAAMPGAGRLSVTKTPAGALYIADSPNAVALAGFVGGQTVTTTGATFTFPHFGNDFAAVTLTPLDRKPLAQSRHLLLTLVGKVENQDMHWNATRTSVGNQWGHGPVMVEGIPATVTFPALHPGHVYVLDATGHRGQEVPLSSPVGGLVMTEFTIGPQYKTVWYEIGE